MAWIWIILALLYMLSPYDLSPDFLPLRGWIDDIVVLILLVRYILRLRQAKRRPQEANPNYSNGGRRETNREADTPNEDKRDPYTVLGISPGSNREEIQSAYRKLANQYHPDKVAHLGAEFQALAEKKFKEIQEAYTQITNR